MSDVTDRRPLRVANCSGFYGDRASAPVEMVGGGDIDVLTGDYLAELTMAILWKTAQRHPGGGYARTFLTQMEEVLGSCIDRGIRVVTNAGGLAPAALARDLRELCDRLGISASVAHVEGDDLMARLGELRADGHRFTNLDTGQHLDDACADVVTANAYLGARGIAAALRRGVDVVVCPRVTDASLVVGPAMWYHDWSEDDWDRLAGAVAVGHVIECGPQATGGNYAFFQEMRHVGPPGFPIAEIAADGSGVITKHAGTPGEVSVGSVTAQLLYEIGAPQYLNPDVVAHFDTVHVEEVGPDRVQLRGTRGTPPPPDLKVSMNYFGGFRNEMTVVLTGLDLEAKAEMFTTALFDNLGGRAAFDEVAVRLERLVDDGQSQQGVTAYLHLAVKGDDAKLVGRRFSGAVVELGLSTFPGMYMTTSPTDAQAYAVNWPALLPAHLVEETIVIDTGERFVIAPRDSTQLQEPATVVVTRRADQQSSAAQTTIEFGRLFGARSGDKGGNANLGVWARDDGSWEWLRSFLTEERLRVLLPDVASHWIERHVFDNLRAVNFVVHGLLDKGVSSSLRRDAQAKGLGEYLRSRTVRVPSSLVAGAAEVVVARPIEHASSVGLPFTEAEESSGA